jgi:dihydrofolate reductase
MNLKAIVCVQEQDGVWAIGNKNTLLFSYSEDMKFFKTMTENCVVICGQKTFESFPNGPLKNRYHIVLSDDTNYTNMIHDHIDNEMVCVCHSIREMRRKLDLMYLDNNEYRMNGVWVIGGGQVYNQLLPFCKEVYVTKINTLEVKEYDTTFPNLDNIDYWELESSVIGNNDSLEFCKYVLNKEKLDELFITKDNKEV